jgi:hypothetical protein
MTKSRLVIRRVSPTSEPVALVAAWLLAELERFSHADVVLVSDVAIEVIVEPPQDGAGIERAIATALHEDRFHGWQLGDGQLPTARHGVG